MRTHQPVGFSRAGGMQALQPRGPRLTRPLLCGRAAAAQGQPERAGADDHGSDAEELRHAQRAAGVQGAPAAWTPAYAGYRERVW